MIIDRNIFRLMCLFILIFFYIPHSGALETKLFVHIDSDWVNVTIKAKTPESEKIISSLEEGLTAEIIFQFRVYKINKGFFSFIGDTLIKEKKVSFIAFKDFFINQYVVRTEDNKNDYFDTVDDFLKSFLTLVDYHLVEPDKTNQSGYYILARTSINPVKLEPPLHIISLFSSIGRTSAWVEYQFPVSNGGQR